MHDEQQHVLKAEPRKTQDEMNLVDRLYIYIIYLYISSKQRSKYNT